MFLLDVTIAFDREVEKLIATKPEFQSWIKNHEKRNVVLNSCCDQIVAAERKMGQRFTAQQRQQIVQTMAKMFVHLAIEQKKQRVMSDAAVYAQKPKTDSRTEELKAVMKEINDRPDIEVPGHGIREVDGTTH